MKRNKFGSALFLLTLFFFGLILPWGVFAQARGILHVYTSQPTNQMTEVIKLFNERYPDVKIELFRSGTTEVMNKLEAEFAAGSPKADVVLIADSIAATKLKNEGRLYAYKEAPIRGIPKEFIDPDMTFFGTKIITTGIMYNTKLAKKVPSSWQDLLEPDIARATIMPSPLYSGAAVIHVGSIVEQPQFGWKYYSILAERGASATQGNGNVVEAVSRGEKAYGIIIEYMAMNAKAKGSPVDFVIPREGVSVITQPVAILKTTKNLSAAKAFVDWQLSDEAQRQAVQQGYYPIIPTIDPPQGYPLLGTVKYLFADPAVLLRKDKENKKRFAELFGG